jgi:hypothetical protein
LRFSHWERRVVYRNNSLIPPEKNGIEVLLDNPCDKCVDADRHLNRGNLLETQTVFWKGNIG